MNPSTPNKESPSLTRKYTRRSKVQWQELIARFEHSDLKLEAYCQQHKGEIYFTYSPSRAMMHLKNQLGEFDGTILSDGYKAYDLYAESVKACTPACCWVHCRRYFEKAESSEPDASAAALVYIGKLYQVEKAIGKQKLQGEKKLQY